MPITIRRDSLGKAQKNCKTKRFELPIHMNRMNNNVWEVYIIIKLLEDGHLKSDWTFSKKTFLH